MVTVLSFRSQQGLNPFTMLPVEGPLKRDFLDIYLTTFFGVRSFGKKISSQVIFFLKMFKI